MSETYHNNSDNPLTSRRTDRGNKMDSGRSGLSTWGGCHNWVGIPGRPPYVIPRGSAG